LEQVLVRELVQVLVLGLAAKSTTLRAYCTHIQRSSCISSCPSRCTRLVVVSVVGMRFHNHNQHPLVWTRIAHHNQMVLGGRNRNRDLCMAVQEEVVQEGVQGVVQVVVQVVAMLLQSTPLCFYQTSTRSSPCSSFFASRCMRWR
jgi:hypothetical protein